MIKQLARKKNVVDDLRPLRNSTMNIQSVPNAFSFKEFTDDLPEETNDNLIDTEIKEPMTPRVDTSYKN